MRQDKVIQPETNGITSSSGFAEAIDERYNGNSPKPLSLDGHERTVAFAIRDCLLLAIKLGQIIDYQGEDFYRNFPLQLDYVWRNLRSSPSKKSADFRADFRDWTGRDPAVSLTAIEGNKKRLEDAVLLCRIVKWVAGPGRLSAIVKTHIFLEDRLLKMCFREFADVVYPAFLHAVVAGGFNTMVHHAGFATLYVRQGGKEGRDVTLRFSSRRQLRWPLAPETADLSIYEGSKGRREKIKRFLRRLQFPLHPMKKVIFTGDAADVRAHHFKVELDSMTSSCAEALLMLNAIIRKHRTFVHLDLDALEMKRLGTRKHTGGVTTNPQASKPLEPIEAMAAAA